MDKSHRKRLVSGPLALLVGLGVLGCTIANLVLADASSAAVPPSGQNCQEEGKISGRGSTFQKVLVTELAALYRNDFCGAVGAESTEKGAAGNTMIAYNYPAAENASATGSGAGEKATDCRTDAFAGTDVPYNKAQLEEMDGTPGAGKELGGTACEIKFEPPFQPKPGPWPNTADVKANLMSFPIGGSSVTIPVHLGTTACTTRPTALNFTPKEVSRILGGDAKEWTEKELVETNPSLSACAGAKITRVVREDNSGTTNITKLYLARVDNERTGAVCAPGKKWEEYNTSPNTIWPGKQEPGKEGACSEITNGPKSGNPELLKKLSEIEGAVGYADLGDAVTNEAAKAAGVFFAHVLNATGTEFVSPASGKGANCDYRTLSLPGTNAEAAVGLDPEDNWANNNKEGNRGNATDLGSKYPICGLTWDMVYTGLNNGAVANANSRLTADQRRTLYSFFTFVFSSAAQESLNTLEYAPLPVSWVGTIREGFQAGF